MQEKKIFRTFGVLIILTYLLNSCQTEKCVCPDLYEPVCGIDGVTYFNDCLAQCKGVYSYTPGECPISADAEAVKVDDFVCGFVLKIGDLWYYPVNLPLYLQFDGELIYVEFIELYEYTVCGDGYEYMMVELLYVE
jgi:hypothetical protein